MTPEHFNWQTYIGYSSCSYNKILEENNVKTRQRSRGNITWSLFDDTVNHGNEDMVMEARDS